MKRKLGKIEIAIVVIIILIVLIDQITKIIVQNVGNINIEQNTNAAYGIDSNSTMMYIITNLVIIVIITKFMLSQNQFIDGKLKIFLSFIISGGISNIIDRIFRGYVLEWIKIENLNWLPVLNIADIFILIGWILVAGNFAYFSAEEWKNRKRKNVKLEDKDKKEG